MIDKLSKFKDTHYIVSVDDFYRIKDEQDKKLTLEDYDKLFSDDTLFEVIKNMPYDSEKLIVAAFNNETEKILACSILTTKVNIIKEAYKQDTFLSDKASDRCTELYKQNLFTPDKIKEDTYKVLVNGKEEEFKMETLYNLMHKYETLDEKEFQVEVQDDIELYAFLDFYDKRLAKQYILNDNLLDNIKKLKLKYDVTAYSKHDFGNSDILKDCHINNEYKEKILREVNEFCTHDVDKALYLYLRLCDDFYYDSRVYAEEEKGPATDEHKNPAYIEKLDDNNNAVVCYSFTALYAKILEELGIKYEIKSKDTLGNIIDAETYANGHQFINVLTPPFNFSLDSTRGVIETDLYNVKMHNPPKGIQLWSDSRLEREFKKRVKSAIEILYGKRLPKEEDKIHEEYDKLVAEYKILKKAGELSIDERLEVLENFVSICNKFKGMEGYSAFVNLRGLLFTKQEQKKNIYLKIIGYQEPDAEQPFKEPLIIVVKNKYNYNYQPEDNEYGYFKPGQKIIPLSKELVEELIDEGKFYGIKDGLDIPGINYNKEETKGKVKKL